MVTVDLAQAKAHVSVLLDKVEAGEEVGGASGIYRAIPKICRSIAGASSPPRKAHRPKSPAAL